MAELLIEARRASVRAVNACMTATYWEIGRRIVEQELRGSKRANYGDELIGRLSIDLTARFGRGFGKRNLFLMRSFYLAYGNIVQTVSARSETGPVRSGAARSNKKVQTVSAQSKRSAHKAVDAANDQLLRLSEAFPLPWSHYVRLLTVEDKEARSFYEHEALRNGWSVRQLDRQVSTRFYERAGASRNRERMLLTGAAIDTADAVHPEREPYLLEFLDLKDEYSESDM